VVKVSEGKESKDATNGRESNMKPGSLHKMAYRRSNMLRVRFVLVAMMIVGGMVLGSESVVWANSSAVAYYKGKPAARGIYNSSSNKFTLSDDACDGKGVEIVWGDNHHKTNYDGCKTKKSFTPSHIDNGKKFKWQVCVILTLATSKCSPVVTDRG
jgi:hypothetical protein